MNLSKQMSLGYEWDKGRATTQARLTTSQLNHKGQAAKFKGEVIELLVSILDQSKLF